MIAVFGILLLLGAVVVHEAGHAVAMRSRGVEIKEAGLGLPITGRFRLTFRTRFLPFPLVLTPALIGAYVQTSEKGKEQLEELSYRDQAVCYAAGVVSNIVFGGALLCIISLAYAVSPDKNQGRALVIAVISGGITAVVAVFRRAFSQMVPVFGIAGLGLLVYMLVSSTDSVGGPGAVVAAAASGKDWIEALLLGSAISVSLGYINMLPLMPLDGGQVVSAYLKSRGWNQADTAFSLATTLVFLGFFGFLIFKDIF